MDAWDPHDTETRVTDATTGGEKGRKLAQIGAMDPLAIIELARVAGYGADKYAAFNYLRGTDWRLMYDAMQRHAMLFWSGENIDPESGRHHMAHAAWMALALVSFAIRGLGTDTRFKQSTTLAAMVEALKARPHSEDGPGLGSIPLTGYEAQRRFGPDRLDSGLGPRCNAETIKSAKRPGPCQRDARHPYKHRGVNGTFTYAIGQCNEVDTSTRGWASRSGVPALPFRCTRAAGHYDWGDVPSHARRVVVNDRVTHYWW